MSMLTLPTPGDLDDRGREGALMPMDPPRAHGAGPAPYRILAVGGRLLAGHGVATHDLALTGAIAHSLAGLLGHGTDVESVVLDRVSTDSLGRAIARRDLSTVDALVLVLDAVPSAAAAALRIGRLVDTAWRAMVPASSITVVLPVGDGPQEHSDPDPFAEALQQTVGGLTRIVALPAARGTDAAQRYAAWGASIAVTIAAALVEPIIWSDPQDRLDERKRARAVRRLGALDAGWRAHFQPLVASAARAYGTSCAAISVIGVEDAHYLAPLGFDDSAVPRGDTICDVALRTRGGLLVGDASADERFRDLPPVAAGAVRFYAGYRIEDPDGQPVGALCVFDAEPRTVRGQDIDVLRDLALTAERRIWQRLSKAQPA